MSGYLLFGANTSGSQIQRMQGLNDLTVSGKSVLQCTSLVASEDVSCNTAVIGDLTVSGNLQVRGNITFSGTLTVCDIFCPNDLFVRAVSNIVMEAPTIRSTGQDVVLVGSSTVAAIAGVALIALDSAAGTIDISVGSAGLVLTGPTGAAALSSTDLTIATTATTTINSDTLAMNTGNVATITSDVLTMNTGAATTITSGTDLIVTTVSSTTISSGENQLESDDGTLITAGGAINLSSSGASGSIIRLKTAPGVNVGNSGAISISTTAGPGPSNNNDSIAIDSASIITSKSTNDTRISAGGAAGTSPGGIFLAATASTTVGTDHQGDINLVPTSGDINLGNYDGNTNTVSPHLVVYGGELAAPIAIGTGSADWAGASFQTNNIDPTTARSGSTDTAGNVFVTGLPTVGNVVAAGDVLLMEFSRAFPSNYVHSLWQGMEAEAYGDETAAAAAGALLSLTAYYTTTIAGNFLELRFLQTVTVAQIQAIVPAYATATVTNPGGTGQLSFGYFNIDSVALL